MTPADVTLMRGQAAARVADLLVGVVDGQAVSDDGVTRHVTRWRRGEGPGNAGPVVQCDLEGALAGPTYRKARSEMTRCIPSTGITSRPTSSEVASPRSRSSLSAAIECFHGGLLRIPGHGLVEITPSSF